MTLDDYIGCNVRLSLHPTRMESTFKLMDATDSGIMVQHPKKGRFFLSLAFGGEYPVYRNAKEQTRRDFCHRGRCRHPRAALRTFRNERGRAAHRS